METNGSLPHSQQYATCPYPKPDRSIPCSPITLLEDPFYYYYPIYTRFFQMVTFPYVSPPKPCVHLVTQIWTCFNSVTRFIQTVAGQLRMWNTFLVANIRTPNKYQNCVSQVKSQETTWKQQTAFN
jgi:hypothetical protein